MTNQPAVEELAHQGGYRLRAMARFAARALHSAAFGTTPLRTVT